MNSKNLFIFNSLVCILFGIPLLLLPDMMMGQYMVDGESLTNTGRVLTKAYGGMLITFGVTLWLARQINNPSLGRTALLWGVFAGNIIATYVWVTSLASGHINNMIIPSIVIISVTAIWAALLLFKKTEHQT